MKGPNGRTTWNRIVKRIPRARCGQSETQSSRQRAPSANPPPPKNPPRLFRLPMAFESVSQWNDMRYTTRFNLVRHFKVASTNVVQQPHRSQVGSSECDTPPSPPPFYPPAYRIAYRGGSTPCNKRILEDYLSLRPAILVMGNSPQAVKQKKE